MLMLLNFHDNSAVISPAEILNDSLHFIYKYANLKICIRQAVSAQIEKNLCR